MTSRQLFAAFAIALVVLVVNAGVSLRSIERMRELQERVTHTMRVEQELQTLLVNVLAAESSQRGYLITERPTFLSPFVTAGARATTSLDSVQALVADNPAQTADVANQSEQIVQHGSGTRGGGRSAGGTA